MIEAYFIQTKRKFYKLVEIQNLFPDYKDELNKLYQDKKIQLRNGLNGKIIENML